MPKIIVITLLNKKNKNITENGNEMPHHCVDAMGTASV